MRNFYKEQLNESKEKQIIQNSKEVNKILKNHLRSLQTIIEEKETYLERFSYKLKAVINHSGEANYGHYFSFIKIKKEWYCFNDSNVTLTTQDEVMKQSRGLNPGYEKCSCYCLFYDKGIFSNTVNWKKMNLIRKNYGKCFRKILKIRF